MHHRNLKNKPSESLIKCMEEAIDLQLYLVQEKGPLCLTFQDNDKKKIQISIGNTITCSCCGGKTEHCVHTIFTLNKFFKIPFNHPFMLHLTFSDAELNQLVEKKNSNSNKALDHKGKSKEMKKIISKDKDQPGTNQMSLIEDSICSICQEDMYSIEGLYYCSNSCGHNYHINCLKIFIQHKRDGGDIAKCPMCRVKWNEEEFNKVISEAHIIKGGKRHQGVNCCNCSRMNIKYERFHCLHCANYDLCSECFGSEIHKTEAHKFIMKKGVDEKWFGCDYGESSNNQRYLLKNIYLNQYLSDCLPNDNTIHKDHYDINANDNGNDIDEEAERGVEEAKKEQKKRCSVCKTTTKGTSTLEFLMLKVFPCGHLIHGKCCEKAFRIVSFENNNIIVDRNFNKCRDRPQTEPIFPGLESIHYKIESQLQLQSQLQQDMKNNGQNNDIIVALFNQGKGRIPRPTANMKKQMIQRILNTPNQYANDYQGGNSLNSAFNIQKINFSNNNDIQNYENQFNYHITKAKSVKPGSGNGSKIKNRIPFKPIQSKIKKSETILARNKPNETNRDFISQSGIKNGDILNIQSVRMNERPVRYENENKVLLSPLLVDLPLNNEFI